MFIFLYNDCQYTNCGINIRGVFATVDEALLFGWKTVLEDARKPWTIKFYTKERESSCRGLGTYYIEEWDMDTNKRVNVFLLGEKEEGSVCTHIMDKYLKRHHTECEQILQSWHDDICAGTVPTELQFMTMVKPSSA
jgi:hypothetical protein